MYIIYIYICICIYICLYICICIFIYIYVYIAYMYDNAFLRRQTGPIHSYNTSHAEMCLLLNVIQDIVLSFLRKGERDLPQGFQLFLFCPNCSWIPRKLCSDFILC